MILSKYVSFIDIVEKNHLENRRFYLLSQSEFHREHPKAYRLVGKRYIKKAKHYSIARRLT